MFVLRALFPVHRYPSLVLQYQARAAYFLLVLMVSSYSLYALSVPEWRANDGQVRTLLETTLKFPFSQPGVVFFSLYLLTAMAYFAIRRAIIGIMGWTLFAMWYLSGTLLLIVSTTSPAHASGAIVLLMVIGGLMIGRRGILAGCVVGAASLIVRSMGSPLYGIDGVSLETILFQITGAGVVIYLLWRYAQLSRREGVSLAVEKRNLSAEILTQIAQEVAQRRALNVLLPTIINAIVDKFDFVYHAQVFLLTPSGQQAQLVASTGTVGQQLIARDHMLDVGGMSVIGQVTENGQPIVARANSREGVHRRNELLPQTAVEAAFPLRVGGRIIGALDLQSADPNAFDDPDLLATFQALADSTSLAIDNVSQFETAQARIQENTKLVEQLRQALTDRERLTERLTGRAWSDYLRGAGSDYGLDINFRNNTIEPVARWTPTLEQAITDNHLVQEEGETNQVIAVPLRVRGQVVGAMEFELDKGRPFSPEDFDLIQEISERFGLAAETARLLDETQRAAQREALVNQISSRLQSNNNVEATLTEAARGLRDAVKAQKVAIRLGAPPTGATASPAAGSNGGSHT